MGQRSRTSVNAIDNFSEPLDRLHAALDASCVVGTWDWDIVRNTMVYDAGAARLLTGDAALAEREIEGEDSIAAVHPADHAWLREHVGRAVMAGGLMLAEYRVIAEDGEIRWLLSRGRTYHDAGGRPVRSRGIIIDITEMRAGGDRYVMLGAVGREDPLGRVADLVIEAKNTLGPDAPSEVRIATDKLLWAIGRAVVRAGRDEH